MQSFLEDVVEELGRKLGSFEETVFILPSKRGGIFLRTAIARTLQKTSFAPEIFSIESFVENISGLDHASHIEQTFELYQVYSEVFPEGKNDFFSFTKWANTLLQDFNEVDRYLIDAKKLFSNLVDIQEVSHWSPDFKKTKMMEDYLEFWNRLYPLYETFNQRLLNKGLGHQGLIYRHAAEEIDHYLLDNSNKAHLFIGFNALNKAETHIIKRLLSDSKNQVYWDIDKYFLEDPLHDAGFFIRRHLKNWPGLHERDPKGVSDHYLSKKDIQIVGVPKNVSQVKFVGNILGKLQTDTKESLKRTAVVLGEEALLNPLLNSIPEDIGSVNVTMGYPLGKTSLANLFIQLMGLYINKENQGWYSRTILDLLSHHHVHLLLTDQGINHAQQISTTIVAGNWTYIQHDQLTKMYQHQDGNLTLLFMEVTPSPLDFVENCLRIIDSIRIKLKENNRPLELEHLYRFHTLFNQIRGLLTKYPFVEDLKSLQSLYKQLLAYETLDFQGEPLEGLQIMGMLESRNLDFETVILTSVNEGILPSGKSNNSFIPLDLKRSFGLPTYKEKDSVYTYHFYRLLQRAKHIYLLYNTEPDVLEGGEKSRLIMQLLTDRNKTDDITETIATPIIGTAKKKSIAIAKDAHLMGMIRNHAKNGFSPTSLSNYIRDPMEFYKRNLLKIDDVLEVEETVAANTLGTIVHNTLEKIHSPFVGKILEYHELKTLRPKIPDLVKAQFKNCYTGGDFTRGKNLIAFNVIVKYIDKFIDLEIEEARNHKIEIIGLEKELHLKIDIPELDFPINLKGNLDRIDKKDGEFRIIDYKTGRVENGQLQLVDWEELITEYDFSKAFQLLCYAKMYAENHEINALRAGIISTKKLNEWIMPFALKESRNSRNKDELITKKTLEHFSVQLKKLILEICDPEIPLVEKEA